MRICIFFLLLVLCFQNTAHASKSHADFVVYAPPKSGTHLIAKVLELMLQKTPAFYLEELGDDRDVLELAEAAKKSNSFIVAHNFRAATLKFLISRRYKVIFIIRDPRDLLVSAQNWLHEGQWNWIPAAQLTSRDDQLDELITGRRHQWRFYDWAFGDRLKIYQGLSKHAVITRFENLVGSQGGGSRKIQVAEIKNIAKLLRFKLSDQEAEDIAEKVFGGTATFRNGQIGKWKNAFREYHKINFKTLYGPTLIELGYEKDLNW